MELGSFIKELLYEHDCVIVPEFGGFVANYRPAEINYNRHTFAPPSKAITFNRSLTNNDGLLIGHVSQRTGMSYVDARKWVQGRVKEWKRRLEKGRRVEVSGLGEFRMGKDGNLLFEPSLTENFLAEAFGLEEFQFAPLEEYVRDRRRTAVNAVTPAEMAARRRRRILVGVPAAAALAALVFVGVNTRLGKERLDLSSFNPFHRQTVTQAVVQEDTAPAVETEQKAASAAGEERKVEKETPAGKEETSAPAVAEEKAPGNEAADPAAAPVGKEEAAPVVTAQYYIVAGSFRHQQNAETLKTQLERAGLPVVIMDGPNGFVRVAIGSYSDRAEALRVLREQRKAALNGDGYWLLKK